MSKNEVLEVYKKMCCIPDRRTGVFVNQNDILIDIKKEDEIPFLSGCDIDCVQLLKRAISFERPDAYYLSKDN